MVAISRKKSKESGDERYDSPEAIEAAFKKQIDSFPKLSYKDKEKLIRLTDRTESHTIYSEATVNVGCY